MVARLSNAFAPTIRELKIIPDSTLAGTNRLLKAGFVRRSSAGIYTLLPLGLRVVRKLQDLLIQHMDSIGAQQISMPSILPAENWKTTERLHSNLEIFTLLGKRFLLAPTHEEEVTGLVADSPISYKNLPLKLYQIGIYLPVSITRG